PTPVVGMVGSLPDPERAGRLAFARDGDAIALAGEFHPALPGGELAKLRGEPLPDGLPGFDAAKVRAAQAAIRDAVRAGELSSAHDIAEGGFLVAVAESCLAGGVGAALDLGPSDDPWNHLYGEGAGGFVVSGPREVLARLAERVPLDVFGTVGGDELEVAIGDWRFAATLTELREANSALVGLFP
ncbi:MAG TPA: AIR synthase-related protein, partial [Gaiellales bacterium]|nr:AIR synthase-related protein [Gaiellales bacterium]